MNNLTQYYTVKEVASKLNIKPSMIYALIKKGMLPCTKCGNKFLLELDDVQECFRALKK